ncbi:MAG: TolC family protein, partial [Bacteroidota bacterium]
ALQASVALATAERRRTNARGEFRKAISGLRILILAGPNEAISISSPLALQPLDISLAMLEERARNRSPGLLAATSAVDAARAQSDVVAARKLPDITLEYSTQTVDGSRGFYGGALRLGLPVWRWFASGPDDAVHAEIIIREAEREETERAIVASVRSFHAEYESAHHIAEDYRERILPAASEAYRIALRLREAGDASYLEVLAAQTALIDTQSESINAIREAERLRLELEYISGEDIR